MMKKQGVVCRNRPTDKHKKANRLLCLVLGLCMLLQCVGCKSRVEGANQTFYYHLPSVVTSLDPQTAGTACEKTLVAMLFEGLYRLDDSGKAVPGAAESCELTKDGLTYTFHLRQDMVWSNGEAVTAQDFVFGIYRALQPQTACPDFADLFVIDNAQSFYEGSVAFSAVGVKATDAQTLQIRLREANDSFLLLTASAAMMPCSEAFFTQTTGRYGLTYRTTLTNGCFAFVNVYSWEAKKSISFEKSTFYTGDAVVYPAYVEVTMGQTDQDSLTMLTGGTTDVARIDLSQVQAATQAGCTVTTFQDMVSGLLFNTQDELFSNEAVRRVFSRVLQAQSLYDVLLEENQPANGLIPAESTLGGENYRQQAGSAQTVLYDEAAAGELSAALGELNLQQLPSVTVICRDDEQSKAIVSQMLVAWNNAFGVYCNMEPLDEQEFASRMKNGNYQMAFYSLVPQDSEAKSYLELFLSTAETPLYNNQTYDAALRTAADAQSVAALENSLLQSCVFYPVYTGQTLYACAPGVSGVHIFSGSGIMSFNQALKKG